MPGKFHMLVKDIFFFRDGRTVFAGPIEEGEKAIVEPGPGTILIDGETFKTVHVEGELIPSRPSTQKRHEVRAVSTRDSTGLTQEMVETNECRLEGTMRYSGHRHLLGIDSPPSDYIPDDMTLGPLSEGWDGDTWMRPDGSSYFLRAWNKANARYAIGMDVTIRRGTEEITR